MNAQYYSDFDPPPFYRAGSAPGSAPVYEFRDFFEWDMLQCPCIELHVCSMYRTLRITVN